MYSISTHNGYITFQSIATGSHRTIRVHTQADDAKFFPGRRLVSLLVGADNETDYQSFGVVDDAGRVHLWRKHQNSDFFKWIARALESPEFASRSALINFDGRCRVCNRTLTTPESVASGIGPKCAAR